ncbi:MAG TPA: Holliday junction resolvase RuvX [Dehalococcoidia bacterium]|nr:Holliday junction resolvase RuvX [Dehalococcoidia bacterium]
MRYMGLDIGDRWIGVAISDPSGILASPLTIIKRKQEAADIEAIGDIIKQNDIGRVIVGLPRSLNGSLGRQAEKVQQFTDNLRLHILIPVEFRDERLTTVSARSLMQETVPRKKRQKARDDAIAAAIILQGFLDEEQSQSHC